MNDRQTADEIDADAARWVVRLDRESPSDTLLAEVEAWCRIDNRNRGALLKAEAAWLLLDSSRSVAPMPEPAIAPARHSPRVFRPSRRLILRGAGACIAAGLATVFIFPIGVDHYRTEIGEVRRVALADRSIAAINTASRIDVVYEEKQRRVTIREGEVWFQVAKNTARPFVVEAGQVRLEAVGTAFSVRRRSAGSEVLVTEGIVRAWVVGAEDASREFKAGSRVFVAETAAITSIAVGPSDLDRRLAWRAGNIELSGDTLAEAVSEFNRYNVRQIAIDDAAAGKQRLYGVFRIDDAEGFARAAATSLGLRSSIAADGTIAIASSTDLK